MISCQRPITICTHGSLKEDDATLSDDEAEDEVSEEELGSLIGGIELCSAKLLSWDSKRKHEMTRAPTSSLMVYRMAILHFTVISFEGSKEAVMKQHLQDLLSYVNPGDLRLG